MAALSQLPERLAPYAATISGFLPLYYLLSSRAQERLAARTLRWAPRWERNWERSVSRIIPALEGGVQKFGGQVENAMKNSEPTWRPHVERVVGGIAGRLEKGVKWGVGLFVKDGGYALA